MRSTRYVSWRGGVVGAGVEDAAREGGGVDVCGVADVVVSVVRNRVVVKEEGRKRRRLGATVAVRSGIWRNMIAGGCKSPHTITVEEQLLWYSRELRGGAVGAWGDV